MPHWRRHLDNSQSKYIGTWDLVMPSDGVTPCDYVAEIVSVGPFMLIQRGVAKPVPKKTRKTLITLRGWTKQFSCNITNNAIISRMYGINDDAWIGKLITLYHNPEVYFGKGKGAVKTGGISVRDAIPTGKPTRPPVAREPDASAAAKDAAANSVDDDDADRGP